MKSHLQNHLFSIDQSIIKSLHSINLSRGLIGISFVFVLMISACSQTVDKNHPINATENKARPTIQAPKIELQAAVLSDSLEAVKQHIQAGTNLNQMDPMSGSTPLITAVSFGKAKIAQELINAGANLSLKNNDGATALHTAAFFGRIEMVQMLLEAGADKSLKNKYGMTPRASIMMPFGEVKPIYELLEQQLAPLGLQLDLNEIEKNRPVIAIILQD
ncbi:ankyrin repeat domain-containing protein [Nonlabens xiamenensis]|uniref:ankyrin repeat domain-containing protein n=1 Tax=Nonlabens xiamenensis TaxID=2341043 RepID=UPI001F0C2824|nr:ankyrin repeat domain-containing protein [Nonlabens xiamenensis]